MVSWISSWAQEIIIAVIVAKVLEMILPEGNNKKYIKMIIGIYILFTIVSPVISKFSNKKIDINTENIEKYFNTQDYQVSANEITINNNSNIENVYKSEIKEDISKRLKEKGYIVNTIEVELELENNNYYGSIKKLELTLSKNSNEIENIQTVNKVEINKDNTSLHKETSKTISDNDIAELKEYLNYVYEIKKNNIYIY